MNMHRYYMIPLWFCLTVTFIACGGCKGSPRDPGAVLAKVGEREITYGAFEERFKRLVPERDSRVGKGDLRSLKFDILNQMVEEELIITEAERLGVEVDEGDISSEVASIKGGYRDDTFEATITGKYGTIEGWQNEIRRKLLIRKVLDSVVKRGVPVTEEEAMTFFQANRDEFSRSEQVKARMIVVNTEEDARAVRLRLRKEPFADVAREVSIGPEGDRGGDLGFFSRGDMPPEFESIVFSLPLKEVSDVIKTPYGYHLFLVEARQEGSKLDFKEVKEKIISRLEEERRERELHGWIRGLKERTTIEITEELL